MSATWKVLGVAALLFAGAALRASAAEDPAALAKREAAARLKCSAELTKAAKGLVALKAFDQARDDLRLAISLAPDDPAPRKELAKVPLQAGDLPDAVIEKSAELSGSARGKCMELLVNVLLAWDAAERPEEFARLATVLKARLRADDMLKPWDLRWYDDYFVWVRPKDAEKLGAGNEFVDGAWADAAKVKELDAAHAAWTSPWILSDGVHEVRTTMPLHTAKRVLEHVSQYRRAVLDYFAGEWDLRTPKGLLPVVVTETQTDYRERIAAVTSAKPSQSAAAVYVRSSGALNPCFVTFEPLDTDGTKKKVCWDGFALGLRHEVGHQIAFEYTKHAAGGMADLPWCTEGVANFLSYLNTRKGLWRITRPAETQFATGFIPGACAWVQQNLGQVQPLSKLLGEAPKPLTSDTEYHVATAVAYFLLEGRDRAYRAKMIQLIDLDHQGRSKPDSFAAVFGKVDYAKLQAEFDEFIKGMTFEK